MHFLNIRRIQNVRFVYENFTYSHTDEVIIRIKSIQIQLDV